ncbi:hypothetical protein EMIT0373P_40322 [Pseudomonas chlororaphis]
MRYEPYCACAWEYLKRINIDLFRR